MAEAPARRATCTPPLSTRVFRDPAGTSTGVPASIGSPSSWPTGDSLASIARPTSMHSARRPVEQSHRIVDQITRLAVTVIVVSALLLASVDERHRTAGHNGMAW